MQHVVNDRAEAPAAIRNDLGAIFISLELSRSTWLITSLSPGGGGENVEALGARRCISPDCWSDLLNFRRKFGRERVEPFRSSPFRKRGWTAFGFTECCRTKGSKATSSIRPRLRRHVGVGERRRTGSTARRCFAHYWRISAANLGCARWSKRRHPKKRTTAVSAASARY